MAKNRDQYSGDYKDWQEQQAGNNNKPRSIIIPEDVQAILKEGVSHEAIINFLKCTCGGQTVLWSMRDNMLKFLCQSCKAEYAYPDDHQYFDIYKIALKPPKIEALIIPQILQPATQTQEIKPKTEPLVKPENICSTCKNEITAQEAKSTLDFAGVALCKTCFSKEMNG